MKRKSTLDWEATAARLELIVECLTDANSNAKLDKAAARRAVAYCRRKAAGAVDDTDAEEEIREFVFSHKQSLDWVFCGDPRVMICRLGESTNSIKGPLLRVV